MPRSDGNIICHAEVISQALEQVTDYENNNRYRQNPKFL